MLPPGNKGRRAPPPPPKIAKRAPIKLVPSDEPLPEVSAAESGLGAIVSTS